MLSQLFLQCILKLEQAGIRIDGVCDVVSTNRSMWKHFGVINPVVLRRGAPEVLITNRGTAVTAEHGVLGRTTNSFEHPSDSSRQVYMLSDTAHLIKCIRNRLYSKKVFHINGKCVRWSCYDALYVADTKHAGDGRVCPKITYNHMNPSNTLKMRVKLTTQTFSKSVAKGLQFYAKRGAPHL